jgi:hypothetical protein
VIVLSERFRGYEKENHSLNGFHNALKEIIKELHVSSTLLLHGIAS